jgi:hypothetical protein
MGVNSPLALTLFTDTHVVTVYILLLHLLFAVWAIRFKLLRVAIVLRPA